MKTIFLLGLAVLNLSGLTAFAADFCDPVSVHSWLEHGANPNQQDELGYTALIHASQCYLDGTTQYGPSELKRRVLAIIQDLIAHGANVNLANEEKGTALFYLSSGGFVESVKAVLAAGGNPNAEPVFGCTVLDDTVAPFTFATCDEVRELQKVLLSAGAKPGNACANPYRPVHWYECVSGPRA